MKNLSTTYPQDGYKISDPIAVFDSGIGGLTTLSQVRKLLPGENFIYFADIAHAPYGEKSTAEIVSLMEKNTGYLLEKKIKALVIACNTATSAAAALLRSRLNLPVLGLEPALKPAAARHQRIAVLATSLTLREEKFSRLMTEIAQDKQVLSLPCPGLMELAEKDFTAETAHQYLRCLIDPYTDKVEALVLGCTHYVFFRSWLEQNYPQLVIYDGNMGVARHLQHVLEEKNLINRNKEQGFLQWDCSLPSGEERDAFINKCQQNYYYLNR